MPGDRRVERRRGLEVLDADPQVVDVAAAASVAAVDGLDAVAVGVAQERPVIVGPVQRPLARAAVVLVSGRNAGAPERVDVLPGRGDKTGVQGARRRMLGVGATIRNSSKPTSRSDERVGATSIAASTVR